MHLHVVYTESGVLLSKAADASWREFQSAHEGFKASLGPWPPEEVVEYLASEHPDVSPSAHEQVMALLAEACSTKVLTFGGPA